MFCVPRRLQVGGVWDVEECEDEFGMYSLTQYNFIKFHARKFNGHVDEGRLLSTSQGRCHLRTLR